MESTCKEEEQPSNKVAVPSNQDDIIKMLTSNYSQMTSHYQDSQGYNNLKLTTELHYVAQENEDFK
jgi:hypothetical protein